MGVLLDIFLIFSRFSQTYVVGTAFDQYNMIYYMVHNQNSSPNPEQSFISAINVQTKQFVVKDVEISPGKLVMWDIDIDSSGKIHYLAKESAEHSSKAIVCRFIFGCIFSHKLRLTTVFGTLSFKEVDWW